MSPGPRLFWLCWCWCCTYCQCRPNFTHAFSKWYWPKRYSDEDPSRRSPVKKPALWQWQNSICFRKIFSIAGVVIVHYITSYVFLNLLQTSSKLSCWKEWNPIHTKWLKMSANFNIRIWNALSTWSANTRTDGSLCEKCYQWTITGLVDPVSHFRFCNTESSSHHLAALLSLLHSNKHCIPVPELNWSTKDTLSSIELPNMLNKHLPRKENNKLDHSSTISLKAQF